MKAPVKTASIIRVWYLKARGHRINYRFREPLMYVAGVLLYKTHWVLTPAHAQI